MPSEPIAENYFSTDIREFLELLHKHRVRYVIVGGEAVIFYGHARYTGDIDVFYSPDEANAKAMFAALLEFWGGNVPDVKSHAELLEPKIVVQFGRPPNRLDLMNHIDAVEFDAAWETRRVVQLQAPSALVPVSYLSLKHLLRNKSATDRPKDRDDVRYLSRAGQDE